MQKNGYNGCGGELEIEVGNDYDYHDAPSSVNFWCEREKNHEGEHVVHHRNQVIRWSQGSE